MRQSSLAATQSKSNPPDLDCLFRVLILTHLLEKTKKSLAIKLLKLEQISMNDKQHDSGVGGDDDIVKLWRNYTGLDTWLRGYTSLITNTVIIGQVFVKKRFQLHVLGYVRWLVSLKRNKLYNLQLTEPTRK